jgi:outer membrane protein TolC
MNMIKKQDAVCILFLISAMAPSSLFSQPLTLHQAINLALAHNQTILVSARESHASSQAALAITEAAYSYHLDFSLATTRSYAKTAFEALNGGLFSQVTETQNLIPKFGLSRSLLTPLGSRTTLGFGLTTNVVGLPSRSYQLVPQFSINFQQPLGLAGMSVGHQDIVRARAGFVSAELGFQLQQEQLIIAVVNSYFQLWLAYRDIERARRELESAKRILQIAELRLRAKSVAESEVLNSRVQYLSAEDNLTVAENQLQNQRRSFAQLLGQDSLQTNVMLVDSIAMDTIRIALSDAVAQALANRREIRQAEISLELAELGVAAAASSNDPILHLSGSYSLSSKNDPSPWEAFGQFPSSAWSVQAGVSFPLLDGGIAKSQLDIAQSSRNIQQNNLQLLRQNIALEVEQIWRGLKLNERRMTTLALNVQIAEEALEIAELRFQHGQISSNEVEQVRSRYLATQESLNSAKVSYKIQSAALAQAMGRLGEWVERQ